MTRSPLGVRATAVVVTASCILTASGCADSSPGLTEDAVVQWVQETAIPLTPVTITARDEPLADRVELERVDGLVGGAMVVGLGESAHGLGEQFVLRQRMARRLVEHHGFRTIAFEEDYGSGVAIDRYVTGGIGDPRELVGSMVSAWRTEQMLDLVAWMREFNEHHRDDPVRFLGTDVTQLRQLSFDALTEYVAEVAPDRSADLAAHLDPIALRGSPGEQIGWVLQHPEPQALVDHASAARNLIVDLPEPTSDADAVERADLQRHAEAVLGFYLNYTNDDPDYRERVMAETVQGWQEQTGTRTIYWAANVHVAATPEVDYNLAPAVMDAQFVPTGHHLRASYGDQYLPIAAVFGSGEVLQGWETGEPSVYSVPAPGEDTLDHTLHRTDAEAILLELPRTAPDPVPNWLHAPATMRLIGAAYDEANDADYSMRVDSLAEGFDAVAYLPRTGPADLLTP